ncbi:MAG TPA: hypothetical protein VN749_13320 [Candidatus Eisenbacteria bacterium]|nr:hypothetical protein [Candidatus Eisenbacteria bacterium]
MQKGEREKVGQRQIRSIRLFVGGVQDFVGDAQALDRPVVYDVRLDDFVEAFRLNPTVENTFGIDRYGWAEFTLIEAAGFVGANELDTALRQLDLEQALQFALALGITAASRMAGFALVHTNKNVFGEFWHGTLSLRRGCRYCLFGAGERHSA